MVLITQIVLISQLVVVAAVQVAKSLIGMEQIVLLVAPHFYGIVQQID